MSNTPANKPYRALGLRLRSFREKLHESLAEVSGAVEIEVDALLKIEEGKQRPSEDILLLLISHLNIKEDEATKLWELAGYEHDRLPITNMINDGQGNVQQVVMIMPQDTRIQYTDMVHVMVNNYGVVMNFMQKGGIQGQPQPIARLGMSKEHARSVLEVLQQTLEHSEQPPKALPESSTSGDQKVA